MSKSAGHTPPAVELDAISPDLLAQLVDDAIVWHVDRAAWDVQQAVEREEREGLRALAQGWAER